MVHINKRMQEIIKFRPAKEKPKIDHWAFSQDEIGVLLSMLSNFFELRPSMS